MSILPIVKYCTKTDFLALFTRVNHYKYDTIFRLKTIKESKTDDSIYIGKNKYSFDTFGVYMRDSNQPTCKIIGCDVVALDNIQPNTELTYDQALHEKELRIKEQIEKEQREKPNNKIKKFLNDFSLTNKSYNERED